MNRRKFLTYLLCLCSTCLPLSIIKLQSNKQTLNTDNNLKTLMENFKYKSEKDLPKKVVLDLCNLCQLNCVECWIRKNEEKIKKENGGFGYVSFKTFKNFVDKHPFIEEIETVTNGEILLNPELEKIVEYAYKKGISLYAEAGVNLNTLSPSQAEALVKYQFKKMVVSIDGATPETYAIYRRGGDFNKVIENVKLINKYKEKYNSPFPHLVYKFILFGHNEHEISKAKELAKELNMEMVFDYNCIEGYSPLKNKEKVAKETGLDFYADKTDYLFANLKNNGWFYCLNFFNTPQINFNGDLTGCCFNYYKSFKLNVFKDGLLKVLNNKKILYAKCMLTDFSVKPIDGIPCSTCLIYSYLKDKNYPLKYKNNNLTT